MVVIGKFSTGSCVSVGTLSVKMGISILALSATKDSLVLLLLVPTCY